MDDRKTESNEQVAESTGQLMRAPQVAQMLGVSVPRAYAVMAAGQIPVVRIGRSVRVSRKHLERWIEEQSAQSTRTTA